MCFELNVVRYISKDHFLPLTFFFQIFETIDVTTSQWNLRAESSWNMTVFR